MAHGPSNETKKQYLSLNLHFPQPILSSQALNSSPPPHSPLYALQYSLGMTHSTLYHCNEVPGPTELNQTSGMPVMIISPIPPPPVCLGHGSYNHSAMKKRKEK
ncbi:hypothetical protein HOY80DRAFT_953308 [Tuber brumale]|nr:hypothetical protein HOY80DRAFT_953308 [Tuber brumale]